MELSAKTATVELEFVKTELQHKQLPGGDRQNSFLLRPAAGSGHILKMSSPPHVRGVRPKVKVRVDLSQSIFRYCPRDLFSALTHSSKLSRPFPPSLCGKYSLSTFHLGCSSSYIFSTFLVILSILQSSEFFQSRCLYCT